MKSKFQPQLCPVDSFVVFLNSKNLDRFIIIKSTF